MKKKKVFFIPYAGASALSYFAWKSEFGEEFEPCLLELAGRGKRRDDAFYQNVSEAAEDIASLIEEQVKEGEVYYVFGHSMGALLAFEAYYKLKEKKAVLPAHVFFSGKDAPHIKFLKDKIYRYDDEKFLKIVSLYGGLPEELYKNEELKHIFMPIIRADFQLLCDFEYEEKMEKMDCDITVLYSRNDFSIQKSTISQWNLHTKGKAEFYEFEGNHFYIKDAYPQIVQLIMGTIDK